MKKGDEIQKRQEIPAGKSIMHGFSSLEKAENAMRSIGSHYNLPSSALLKCGYDDLNPGKFAVITVESTYVMQDAKVNWVVGDETSITFKDSGGYNILDAEDIKGWVVIVSAKPTYQSGVENMSDDELRASIEALRSNRVAKPVSVKKKASTPKAPPMSAADKLLQKTLGGMSAEAKLELQRKLGLVD